MECKRVLVVEDDDLNMKLVRDVLQFGQYRVLEAGDAQEGIRLAREHHPDLILMDISLPGMDGLTATRTIHAYEELRKIPIIALTALAMRGDREKALAAGCADYVSKPFNIVDLLDVLNRYL
jgi:two-component system cell cycle response regulator DivK